MNGFSASEKAKVELRRPFESVAAQGYREGLLTLGEVRALLGHETRMETGGVPQRAVLKEQGALLDYSEEELEQDLEAAPPGTRGTSVHP